MKEVEKKENIVNDDKLDYKLVSEFEIVMKKQNIILSYKFGMITEKEYLEMIANLREDLQEEKEIA